IAALNIRAIVTPITCSLSNNRPPQNTRSPTARAERITSLAVLCFLTSYLISFPISYSSLHDLHIDIRDRTSARDPFFFEVHHSQQFAVLDKHRLIHKTLYLIEQMCGDDKCISFPRSLKDQRDNLLPRLIIHSVQRLIQQIELCLPGKRRNDLKLGVHSAGEFPYFHRIFQPHLLHHV